MKPTTTEFWILMLLINSNYKLWPVCEETLWLSEFELTITLPIRFKFYVIVFCLFVWFFFSKMQKSMHSCRPFRSISLTAVRFQGGTVRGVFFPKQIIVHSVVCREIPRVTIVHPILHRYLSMTSSEFYLSLPTLRNEQVHITQILPLLIQCIRK